MHRANLKRIIPRIFVDAARAKSGRLYPTWAAALDAARQSYLDPTVNLFRIEREILDPGASAGPTDLLVATALLIGKPDLAVTDFGGSTGAHSRVLLSKVSNAAYTVVENETIVRLANERLRSNVRFSTQIPMYADIFFTSCTLQYLEDPIPVIEAAFSTSHTACLFVRNTFSEKEQIRVQKSHLFDNGGGALPPGYANQLISYPHRTIRESDIARIANSNGFVLAARMPEQSTAWPVVRNVYGAQLLYLRCHV